MRLFNLSGFRKPIFFESICDAVETFPLKDELPMF